jgi:hypothetical protein
VVEGTLNGNGYIDLVSRHLVPYLEQVRRHGPGVTFYDDNASCHVAGPWLNRNKHKTSTAWTGQRRARI